MLRRAGIATVIALVAALLGFTGLLQSTEVIVQGFFFVVSAFAFLSLVFSLFEPGGAEHHGNALRISASHREQ
jgi:uncharacterized membrane protein YtjA (UPF0391 family)